MEKQREYKKKHAKLRENECFTHILLMALNMRTETFKNINTCSIFSCCRFFFLIYPFHSHTIANSPIFTFLPYSHYTHIYRIRCEPSISTDFKYIENTIFFLCFLHMRKVKNMRRTVFNTQTQFPCVLVVEFLWK